MDDSTSITEISVLVGDLLNRNTRCIENFGCRKQIYFSSHM
jgi:hypothetical protein